MTSSPPDSRSGPGPGRRDALLVATGTYDDRTLRALRSPEQDCTGLAGVLADPGIGAFHTEQVRDAAAHQVMRAVERFFLDRGRDDLLLLHVSCHGIKDDDGHLYFAARDTDRDLPASTAVPAAFLRASMDRCRARTIVVLLDCCYSGAFLPGAKGDEQVHVREELGGHGRAVLTATNRAEYAWEGEHVETAAPQPSRFTGALIEGLRTGAADLNGDGRITVTEWYEYVYEYLRRSGARQHPRMWADLEYQVTVAWVAGASSRGGADVPRAPVRRGQDALIRLELSLEETALGTQRDIRVDTAVVCSTCSGSGQGRKRCEACAGRGEREEARRGALEEIRRGFLGQAVETLPCPACQGRGTVGTHCPECDGDGRVGARRTLTLRIPAGVGDGARIQLGGQGEVGPGGGDPGDLYVEVVELPHRVLQRQGDDLHRVVTVPRATAAAGGIVRVDTLDGTKRVKIPQGTGRGRTMRLGGLGAAHLHGDGRGDFLIHIEIGE